MDRGPSVQDLRNNINVLDNISHCLDRQFTHLQDWRHFAYLLGVPADVIPTCTFYFEKSPTIKLFEYLQATTPQLTIEELRHALVSRPDVYKMIEGYSVDAKVSECITNSTSDILEQIALELDSALKPVSSWKELGKKLGISRDKLKLFEMYSGYNPTEALLRHVCVTNKRDVPLVSYLKKMEREDVLKIVRDITQSTDIDSLNAKDVFKPGSELLEKICQKLNQNIEGASGWRRLARLLIDDGFIDDKEIIDKLEPPDPHSIHSPTKKILEWIAVNKEEITIKELVEVLEKMQRYDSVKILNAAFFQENIVNIEVVFSLDSCDTDGSSESLPKQEHLGIQETYPTQVEATILEEGHYDFGTPSPTTFIGRTSERSALWENLTQGEYQLIVLRGTPGSGKTSLVKVVAHDLIKKKHLVIYVNSRGVLTLDYLAVKILTTCGFSDVDNPIPKVKRLFATLQRNCVLILDNVDGMYYSSAANSLPEGPTWKDIKDDFKMFIKDICSFSDSKKLKVLITSWEPIDYSSLMVKDLVLEEMSKLDCIKLLQSELPNLCTDDAEKVVICCGGIPLLLCGAVKTIKTLGNVNDFCNILQSSPPGEQLQYLCPQSFPKEENFSNCLEIFFKRMSDSTQLVLILVSIFPSVFTKKNLKEIVDEIGDLELHEVDIGLIDLKEYCFLSYDRPTESYSLHSAIRDFGHKISKESEKFQVFYKQARQLFLCFTLNSLSDCETKFFSADCKCSFESFRSKLENIKQVVQWCITSSPPHDDATQATVENACVNSFFDCAVLSDLVMSCKELKLLLCKMAQFCDRRAKKAQYFDCLVYGGSTTVRGCLCPPYVCGIALERALWCFERAKEVLSSVGSTEILRNESRAEFHIMYGKCMVREGRKEEGLQQIHQGLKLLDRKLKEKKKEERKKKKKQEDTSKEEVMLAAGYNDLADAYSYCGQVTKAISTRQDKVFPTFQNILGIHPFTAKALSLNARDYHTLGQYNEALKAVNKALFYQRNLLGNHRETARSYFDMGRILSEQLHNTGCYGRDDDSFSRQQLYNKALEYLQKALEIQQNTLDSPEETAKTHLEIAVVFTQLENTEDAEVHMQAIESCMKKMETAHVNRL